MIDIETLRSLLRYEPETGKLFWFPRPRGMFTESWDHWRWNTRFAGQEALTTLKNDGYLQGRIFNRKYAAHRVAWAVQTGAWPTDQIDHINGVRSDNRFSNLREATRSQNGANRRAAGVSRYLGVSFDSHHRRWVAHITVDGRSKYLGGFSTEGEAATAYNAAAIARHGEFAKLNQSA